MEKTNDEYDMKILIRDGDGVSSSNLITYSGKFKGKIQLATRKSII